MRKRLKKLKMRKMYMPVDKLKRVRRTRTMKNELKEVPICELLPELKEKEILQ